MVYLVYKNVSENCNEAGAGDWIVEAENFTKENRETG